VEPVHAPPPHVPAAQAQGVPHRPVTSQVCSAETPEHRDTPGVQPPPSAPPLLPLPVLEPPLLELAVPELLDPELPPDPELLLLAAGVELAELPSLKLLPAPDPSGSAANVAELPSTPLAVLDSGLPPPELLPPPDSDRLDAESGGPGPGCSLISPSQAMRARAAAPTNETRLMIQRYTTRSRSGRASRLALIDWGSAGFRSRELPRDGEGRVRHRSSLDLRPEDGASRTWGIVRSVLHITEAQRPKDAKKQQKHPAIPGRRRDFLWHIDGLAGSRRHNDSA